MSSVTILTVREGKERLQELELEAINSLKLADESFNRAILSLWAIRKDELWKYALDHDGVMLGDYQQPKFETYLALFSDKVGRGRSSLFEDLRTVTVWDKLGRDVEELLEIGVNRVAPLKYLVHMDGRTGDVVVDENFLRTVPSEYAKDPLAAVNQKIQEVFIEPAIPLRQADVRKALIVDTNVADSITFSEDDKGRIWCTFDTAEVGDSWEGVVMNIESIDAPEAVIEHVMRKLNVHRLSQ